MTTRRFNISSLQNVYDEYAAKTAQDIAELAKRGGLTTDIAFVRGFTGKPLTGMYRYGKKSLAYAAYCAGKDRAEALHQGIDWRQKHKVYRAIERDSLSDDREVAARADAAMVAFTSRTITAEEFAFYVRREEEHRQVCR